MKKVTISFISILMVAVIALTSYVQFFADEFVEPSKADTSISEDSPVWDATIEDYVNHLVEAGVFPNDDYNELTDGIATVARLYHGVEFYWWDLEHMDEKSPEYIAYQSAVKEGVIDLWGSGILMNVTVRGPFAYSLTSFEGDVTKFEEAFLSFYEE